MLCSTSSIQRSIASLKSAMTRQFILRSAFSSKRCLRAPFAASARSKSILSFTTSARDPFTCISMVYYSILSTTLRLLRSQYLATSRRMTKSLSISSLRTKSIATAVRRRKGRRRVVRRRVARRARRRTMKMEITRKPFQRLRRRPKLTMPSSSVSKQMSQSQKSLLTLSISTLR